MAIKVVVWLRPAAGVPCSNAAIYKNKTWMQSEFCTWQKFRHGRKPPKMYVQCTSRGDGQRSCKVWLASGEQRCCSNEAKTRNRLKFGAVPQTGKPISAISGAKFSIL